MSGTIPAPPLEIFQQPAAQPSDLTDPTAVIPLLLPPLAPSILPRVRLANPGQLVNVNSVTPTSPIDTTTVLGRTMDARARDVINVRDFGARGNGLTDSTQFLENITSVIVNGVIYSTSGWTLAQWQAIYPTATALTNLIDGPAINAALAFARATSSPAPICNIEIPFGTYTVDISINCTQFANGPAALWAHGATINSKAAGLIAWDMVQSSKMEVYGLTIIGDPTLCPAFGLMCGRAYVRPTGVGASNLFMGCTFNGSFTTGSALENAGESTTFLKCRFGNSYGGTGGPGHALIIDSLSHWVNTTNPMSVYCPNTGIYDTLGSLDALRFLNCDYTISTSGIGATIWMSQCFDAIIEGSVEQNGAQTTSNGAAIICYFILSAPINDIDIKLHEETSNLKHAFYITGTPISAGGSPFAVNFTGFKFRDHSNNSTISFMEVDPNANISGIRMVDMDIAVHNFSHSPPFLGQPSLWSMQGRVWCPFNTLWPTPATNLGITFEDFTTVQLGGTLLGATNGQTPPAGSVGEVLIMDVPTNAPVNQPTSATPVNIGPGLLLQPGNYKLGAFIGTLTQGNPTVTQFAASVSPNSGTMTGSAGFPFVQLSGTFNSDNAMSLGEVTIQVTTATTYYLVSKMNFSGGTMGSAMNLYGRITAVRDP